MVGYTLTGCTRSMFANRLSFSFDFRGPSFAVDTGSQMRKAMQRIESHYSLLLLTGSAAIGR